MSAQATPPCFTSSTASTRILSPSLALRVLSKVGSWTVPCCRAGEEGDGGRELLGVSDRARFASCCTGAGGGGRLAESCEGPGCRGHMSLERGVRLASSCSGVESRRVGGDRDRAAPSAISSRQSGGSSMRSEAIREIRRRRRARGVLVCLGAASSGRRAGPRRYK